MKRISTHLSGDDARQLSVYSVKCDVYILKVDVGAAYIIIYYYLHGELKASAWLLRLLLG